MQGNQGGGEGVVLITRNREIDYRVDWYDVWGRGTMRFFSSFVSVHRGYRGLLRARLLEIRIDCVTKIVIRYPEQYSAQKILFENLRR